MLLFLCSCCRFTACPAAAVWELHRRAVAQLHCLVRPGVAGAALHAAVGGPAHPQLQQAAAQQR